MERREFIKKSAIFGVGISVPSIFLSRCEPKITSPSNSFDDYVPDVNSVPYKEPKYSLQKKTTGNSGNLSFQDGEDYYNIYFHDKNRNLISGLETIAYKEDVFNSLTVLVNDPQKRFMPTFFSPESFLAKKTGLNEILLSLANDLGSGTNVVLQQLGLDLPEWYSGKADDLPGFVYLADWSFESLKDFNTILKGGSFVAGFAFPAAFSATAFFAKTGSILDNLDLTMDAYNQIPGVTDINKYQYFSIYASPTESPFLVLFPVSYGSRSNSVDFEDLFPTKPGNSWRYKYENYNLDFRISGTKKVNGKELLVATDISGLEQYLGYSGNNYCYYGFNSPEIGAVYFDGPIKMGSNNMRINSTFSTRNSKVIVEDHPEITGTITEEISYVDRQNFLACNKPFGDCWKAKDYSKFVLEKEGYESISDEATIYRRYAKNVGVVSFETLNGTEIQLSEYNVIPKSFGKICAVPEENISSEVYRGPSIERKIVNGIKKLI